MSSYENLIDRCKSIATMAHSGQIRKYSGEPYVNHCERVSREVDSDIEKAAALLHDVLEDTNTTVMALLEHDIPDEVIQIVKIVTRNKEKENYYEFIMRIIESRNKSAMRIKMADLQDNMSDLEEGCLKDKYRLANELIQTFLQ
jgi:(p)ppGpp synthase/HD superfamily hydrolase